MSTLPREDAVFAEALARPAAERRAFLDGACGGDAALRARVEALLAAGADAPAYLEQSPANSMLARDVEQPGYVVGRYKLLEKIGEGGCGVVWAAEQREPVKRRVALKIIKLGMDTREVIARFTAERQALALMHHPNIAKVLDAGATDSGRPFFAMELVRGVPITRFCDDKNLPATERLNLFIQVCHAVQHAHQKGIIHRDIKPSNILVTLHDDAAVPVVIDFGIAKAIQGHLADQTLYTAFDQFIGTPAYMSPEQADYNALDVDTRTDIYSLGVLLYVLLTGRPPFDPKTLTNVALDQLRRVIREIEPPRPSARLRTLGDEERTDIARLRGTQPHQLSTLLRGDLDWIVMKAMEKNRTRRYETATALAADITRYLNHEPVTARPPSTAYRLSKFARRHRFGVAAAAAVTVTLVTGLIATTWQMVRATRAEEKAVAEGRSASRARDDMQRLRSLSEKLLFFALGDLRDLLKSAGREDLKSIEAIVEQVSLYVAGLKGSNLNDTERLGQVKALSLIGAVRVEQKRFPEAMSVLTEAYELASQLSTRQPANADILYERAQVEYWIGFLHFRKGDDEANEQWLRRYRASALTLVRLDPKNPRGEQELLAAKSNLAVVELERGNLDAAHEGLTAKQAEVERKLLERPKDGILRASLATTHSWFGYLADLRGNYPEALDRYRAETSLREALLADSPLDRELNYKVTVSRRLQAEILLIAGRLGEARELLARVLADFDALVAHDSSNSRWRINLFAAELLRIALEHAEGRRALAQERLSQLRPRIEKLVTDAPEDRAAAVLAITAWRIEAELRLAARRSDDAAAAEQAVGQADRFLAKVPVKLRHLGECALAFNTAGRVAGAAGQPEAAQRHWRRALELLEPRLANSNDRRLLDPAARALALSGRSAEARAIIARLDHLGYRPLQPWP